MLDGLCIRDDLGCQNKYFTEMLVDSLTGRLNLIFHSDAVFSIQQKCKIECWLGKLDSIFHGVAG